MKPNRFAKWLKGIIVGTTLIGIGCLIYVIPQMMSIFRADYPEFSYWIMPWKILIVCCSIPCFVAMGLSWKIASNIQKDCSFCHENAKLFQLFSYLALTDAIVFLFGSVVYFLCGMNHPGLLILELLIVFAGLAVYACTAALSYFVSQAADLQQDSDLTI